MGRRKQVQDEHPRNSHYHKVAMVSLIDFDFCDLFSISCWYKIFSCFMSLTLKRLWRKVNLTPTPPTSSPHPPPPLPSFLSCGFSKSAFFRGESEALFFMTFNIVISHIFPENCIEICQVVQKI